MLAGMPDYRADLYAAGARFQRTERFDASNPVEAIERARRILAEHGQDYAVVYLADGYGRTTYIGMVGVAR